MTYNITIERERTERKVKMSKMLNILEAAEILGIDRIEVQDATANDTYYRGSIMEVPVYIFSSKNTITNWCIDSEKAYVQLEFCEQSQKVYDRIYS